MLSLWRDRESSLPVRTVTTGDNRATEDISEYISEDIHVGFFFTFFHSTSPPYTLVSLYYR
jgi:hypothetical protein